MERPAERRHQPLQSDPSGPSGLARLDTSHVCVFVLAGSLSWPLQNLGPFTAFVPINKAFRGTPVRTRRPPRPQGHARSVTLLFVLQVSSLTADPSKARYLCQLHLAAGVMTLDTLKKSDEFYTLTGKSAEMDTSGGVRAGAAVA